MKYRTILFEQLKSLPYFEKGAIRQLSEQHGLKSTTVDSYVSQTLKRKEILSLRKGLYVSADFYNKNKGDISYIFYLANILRRPSYVSSWTALQFYNLTTEVIHTTMSVTKKTTRDYKTKIGDFSYQSIKSELFSGFNLGKSKFDYFMASPSKALFDLLYFRTRQFNGIRFENIDSYVGDLRVDLDEMDDQERHMFYSMVKSYIHHE